MMCSRFLPNPAEHANGWFYRTTERGFEAMQNFYRRTLAVALRHSADRSRWFSCRPSASNVYLFAHIFLWPVPVPGHRPADRQHPGRSKHLVSGDELKLTQLQSIVQAAPAVDSVVGFTGGRQTNSGFVFVSLKPLAERKASADLVVGRLRGKLGSGSRRPPLPAGGGRSAAPAGGKAMRCINSPCRPTIRRRCIIGRRS